MAESPHHAVWLLLTKSAARMLDYDARVCPWSELCDAAERCETDVITHAPTPCRTDDQHGGASGIARTAGRLRLTSSCADAHNVARTQATTKLVKEALGMNQEFVYQAVTETAGERLTDKGVKSADGQVTRTDWAEQTVNSGPVGELTRRPMQDNQRCGAHTHLPMRGAERIVGSLETIEATRLWERAGPQRRI